jgi:dihydrofolate reductase
MNLVVAVDEYWGIGKDGTQTVVIPEDRKRFRELTDGGTVIVGHRTLHDFPGGKPLPGRNNIVMSRNRGLKIEGAAVVSSTEELSAAINGLDPDKVFVIGGAHIFRLLLPYCRYAYVTKLIAAPPSDAFFPNLDEDENWVAEDTGQWTRFNGIAYAFWKYRNTALMTLTEKEET